MEIEKKVVLLQNSYAASIAETVNTYEKCGVLDSVVAKRQERQALTAPYMNQQLSIQSIEDVFSRLSEIYGCANWSVEKTQDGFTVAASACKLCALSKKMGGASPCEGWCLDPMKAMLMDACKNEIVSIDVKNTLMNGDCCKILIRTKQDGLIAE